MLVGSYAENRQNIYSDIDLCIIGNYEGFSRVKELVNGFNVELMIAPYVWYENVVLEYERQSNIGTITYMLSHCKCIYSKTDDYKKLIDLAKAYYEKGPEYIQVQIDKDLRAINHLYNNLSLLNETSINYKWMCQKYLSLYLDLLFKKNQWWAVKDIRALEILELKKPSLYPLVANFIENYDRKSLRTLHSIL